MYSQHEAGPGFEPLVLLEPQQLHALSCLLGGMSIAATAREIGVHRSTVHRWMDTDHAFRAVYNRRLRELQRTASARIEQMVLKALDRLEEALDAHELTPSETLRFLQSAGALTGERVDPGPSSIDVLIDESFVRLAERHGGEQVAEWFEIVQERVAAGERETGGTLLGYQGHLTDLLREALKEDRALAENGEPSSVGAGD